MRDDLSHNNLPGRQADGSVGFYAFVPTAGGGYHETWVRRKDGRTVEDVPTGRTFKTFRQAERASAERNGA